MLILENDFEYDKLELLFKNLGEIEVIELHFSLITIKSKLKRDFKI